MNQKRDNIAIEIYRVFFTSVIVLHHFRMYSDALPFGGGYMATDFFFMLAGLLLYKSFVNHSQCVILYMKKRYVRLWFPLIFCNVLLLIFSKLIIRYDLVDGLFGYIRENLMLEFVSYDSASRFNAPTWYLGVMFLCGVILWEVLYLTSNIKIKRLLIGVLAVIPVVYLTYVFFYGNGNIYISTNVGSLLWSYVRGFSGMCVGIIVANLMLRYKEPIDRLVSRRMIGSVITIFILLVDIYLFLWRDGYTRSDILVYLWIIVIIALADMGYDYRDNVITQLAIKFGKISLFAYLIHFPLVRIVTYKQYFAGIDWKVYSFVFLCSCWLIAMVIYVCFTRLKRWIFR